MKEKSDEKEINELHERLKSMMNEDQKCSLITTMMGMAGVLTRYIVENVPLKTVPIGVHYAMAMTSGNIMTLMSGEMIAEMVDLTDSSNLGEQTEEAIYRNAVSIIELLYKDIQERNNDL